MSSSSMAYRKPLSINIALINDMEDDDIHQQDLGLLSWNECSSSSSRSSSSRRESCYRKNCRDEDDDIYRCEGLTIGRNYLRIQGKVLSQLEPGSLHMGHTIGRGAFSRVIVARMRTNNQPVALKQIPLNSTERQMMLSKELQILSQLDCECLVTLLGAFLESNTVTLVLEYMDYGSLEKLFLSMKHLPDRVSAAITYQALWGLSYLHYEHRLHRDIKPGNILLHSDGSVKLSDFGISAVADSLKMNSTVVGTMKYMALERLRNKEYSKPSDVWSLGLVVWQCLTGSFCFCKLESVVELVVTLEDVVSSSSSSGDSLLSIMDNEFDDNVRELLEGFLQVRPEKRMPACVLLRSPWFESEGVTSLEEAKVVIREFLSQR